jgi:hypothetical protein
VVQDIQARSTLDATIHVLIPKTKADPLKGALAAAQAAAGTLSFKGEPGSDEGRAARAAMASRQAGEESKIRSLMSEIVGGARLFLSGGQELTIANLKAGVEEAAKSVLDRLYPQFHLADSPNWPTVWKKAKEGSGNALAAVNHPGDPHQHPVTAAILAEVGAGKKGAAVESHFAAGPYGWPKDAVDAGIAVLLVSGHLGARLHGQPVRVADLDQKKIGQSELRVEQPVLTAVQKLKIKQLFQAAGHKFHPGDEAAAAPGFVGLLKQRAQTAGGEAPAPVAPNPPILAELGGLAGNELLLKLHHQTDTLTQYLTDWQATAKKIQARTPGYTLAGQLLAQASDLPGIDTQAQTLEAIRANRSLLDDPDPTATVLQAVATALRGALAQAQAQHAATLAAEQARLDAQPVWAALPEASRAELLRQAGALAQALPATGNDAELLAALQQRDLRGWRDLADALPTRCDQALAASIKAAEPKARRVTLPGATIHDQTDLADWFDRVRAKVEAALAEGPVIL